MRGWTRTRHPQFVDALAAIAAQIVAAEIERHRIAVARIADNRSRFIGTEPADRLRSAHRRTISRIPGTGDVMPDGKEDECAGGHAPRQTRILPAAVDQEIAQGERQGRKRRHDVRRQFALRQREEEHAPDTAQQQEAQFHRAPSGASGIAGEQETQEGHEQERTGQQTAEKDRDHRTRCRVRARTEPGSGGRCAPRKTPARKPAHAARWPRTRAASRPRRPARTPASPLARCGKRSRSASAAATAAATAAPALPALW